MAGRGLDDDGTIAREGSLERVQEAFAPVVRAARSQILEVFGGPRLHSGYLYGSIPRGTARCGESDLDLLVVLRNEPTSADQAAVRALDVALDEALAQVDGVGILLAGVESLLSELERYDLGFFVTCLCTPLLGDDLAYQLPRYRPTSLLARETNGDLQLVLPKWGTRVAQDLSDGDRRLLSRNVGRRLVRTGFTLVMPTWNGWTSDLRESAEIFGRYYPQRRAQMRTAAEVGRTQQAAPGVLRMLIDDLGPWLAAEYATVHGIKAPRC